MTMGIRRNVPSTADYAEEETEEVTVPARGLRAATKSTRVVEAEAAYEDEEEAVEEEPEDEAPAPARRLKSAAKAKPAPEPEPEFEEEDDDEVPANAGIIQSGWGEAKKRLSQQATLTNDFKVTEDEQLVRFIGDKPFMFDQHWIERNGKKSFICLGKKVCPLCRDLGDAPSLKYGFQVVSLFEEDPAVQWWIAGIKVYKQLEKYNDKAPLNKGYFLISKTGTKNATVHAINPVKERDLEEDYEIDPAALRELLSTLKPLEWKTLRPPTQAELQEIADEIKRS